MTWTPSMHVGLQRVTRLATPLLGVAMLVLVAAVAACGGGSPPSGQSGSSPSASSGTAPTSSPARTAEFAANLTFTGSLAGTAGLAKAPKGTATCEGGNINVGVTLNGKDYNILILNTAYKGPAVYTIGDASSGTLVLLSDAEYGGRTAYSSTGGKITYLSDKSYTIDADLSAEAGTSAHVSGSASCA